MALDIALLPCAGKDEAGFHSMLTHATPTLDETLQRHILLRRLVTAQQHSSTAAQQHSSTAHKTAPAANSKVSAQDRFR